MVRPSGSVWRQRDTERVVLPCLVAATREGIRQIVQVFRDHLASAFRFPPDVVKALEEFL
jgi:hypothetical protein